MWHCSHLGVRVVQNEQAGRFQQCHSGCWRVMSEPKRGQNESRCDWCHSSSSCSDRQLSDGGRFRATPLQVLNDSHCNLCKHFRRRVTVCFSVVGLTLRTSHAVGSAGCRRQVLSVTVLGSEWCLAVAPSSWSEFAADRLVQ